MAETCPRTGAETTASGGVEAAALAAQPRAQAMFDILTRQNRYAVLYRIVSAKRFDTRTRRIENTVAMLARGETVYSQKRTLAD